VRRGQRDKQLKQDKPDDASKVSKASLKEDHEEFNIQ
jgi:hypothetical protein